MQYVIHPSKHRAMVKRTHWDTHLHHYEAVVYHFALSARM